MALKALITGITGQDGSYLAEFLLSKGYEVHGILRQTSQNLPTRVEHLNGSLVLHNGDMTDYARLQEIVHRVSPDEVYNLAAQSHVHMSFEQPVYTTQVNALAPVAILEALRETRRDAKFYQAATSEMFGSVTGHSQNEETPFHPRSPYACSKVAAFYQTVNYREAYGMWTCNGVLFNHESPRRGEMFVTRKITRAATRIKEGLQKELKLGNLDAKRDWGFAGDYVQAMWMMLNVPMEPDDYVIATGVTYTIYDFLNSSFSLLDLNWRDYVQVDESFKRPAEVNYLRGNSSKARTRLGWQPKVNFPKLVQIMVESDWKIAIAERMGKTPPPTVPYWLSTSH